MGEGTSSTQGLRSARQDQSNTAQRHASSMQIEYTADCPSERWHDSMASQVEMDSAPLRIAGVKRQASAASGGSRELQPPQSTVAPSPSGACCGDDGGGTFPPCSKRHRAADWQSLPHALAPAMDSPAEPLHTEATNRSHPSDCPASCLATAAGAFSDGNDYWGPIPACPTAAAASGGAPVGPAPAFPAVNGNDTITSPDGASGPLALRLLNVELSKLPSVVRVIRLAGMLGGWMPAIIIQPTIGDSTAAGRGSSAATGAPLLPPPPPPGVVRTLYQLSDGRVLPGEEAWNGAGAPAAAGGLLGAALAAAAAAAARAGTKA